jgi:hypothetical protein
LNIANFGHFGAWGQNAIFLWIVSPSALCYREMRFQAPIQLPGGPFKGFVPSQKSLASGQFQALHIDTKAEIAKNVRQISGLKVGLQSRWSVDFGRKIYWFSFKNHRWRHIVKLSCSKIVISAPSIVTYRQYFSDIARKTTN